MKLNNFLASLKRIFGLGFQLAKAEFKLRNEGSYLGIFWYLLNPLLVFGLLFFIFSDRLGNNISNYPLYLMLGVIVFNFFQSTTTDSVTSVIKDYRWVIKSINFPIESLLVSIVLKNLFSHLLEIIFFAVFLIFSKISLIGILYYLLVLIFLCLFIFGISLFLASLTVYFVDLENIWSFVVRLLWLATPIFYSIGGQTKLFYLNLFNPMYYFITFARDVAVYIRVPDASIIFGTVFCALLSLSAGLLLFNALKVRFAEKI